MPKKFTLKVYPKGRGREIYRTLEISGEKTLDDLCLAILDAFNFTHEHLYEFCMDNKPYSDHSYMTTMADDDLLDDDIPNTAVALSAIGLSEGVTFTLHYDFGDDWLFPIRVVKIEDVPTGEKTKVVKVRGVLSQYR